MSGSAATSAARDSCAQVAPELVAGYARGSLDGIATWSVEAHLPGCGPCRSALAATLDQLRMTRNRSILLARAALPAPGPVERAITRCGIPSHAWQLLSVTPSLRRSWLAGVALVLAAAIGAARLVTATAGSAASGAGRPIAQLASGWPAAPAALLPFLVLAPLLPLAGVAAAFHPRLDPAADLATAAPVSGVWLFFVRSVAVIATALVPTVAAAMFLPGGGWLPLLVVLPALAVSMTALALSTLTGPVSAAIATAIAWVAVVSGLGLAAVSPAVVYGGQAQAASLVVIVVACCLTAARRRTLELRWNR
jgi:hypothetical protein